MSDPQQTRFKKVDYTLNGLLEFIDIGDIGLPDIQRPFVWSASKVRDLFDSMYRGFPIGYLLFWANDQVDGTKQIGIDDKAHKVPKLLIVDGQQRLTSLYAVFRGQTVIDENYQEKRIEIAFRPRDGKFEVADAAIRRDPEYIPNISEMWANGKSSYGIVSGFLRHLEEKATLTEEERETIAHNLDRLFDIQKYPFTALEISPTVDEEQVADIFVRINSEGVKLNQADFILTLLSVFWDEGRAELERFSRISRKAITKKDEASPFNHFITPQPDQLLRVSVALGFKRGRLKSVYQVLRGKDLETGLVYVNRREQQFAILKEAQQKTLDLTHWHQFFSSLIGAGFWSGDLVSSQNALLYAYAFYLIGRTQYKVPENVLQKLIGRWFFCITISRRYTTSPETVMDGDLSRIKDLDGLKAFIARLERIMSDSLTGDFWGITLVNDLETSAARNPAIFGYYAAQNLLGAPVLFSHKKVSDLLDPAVKAKKKALERHHLFPKAHLAKEGIEDIKQTNQAANFALLEWPENIAISDQPPNEYIPEIRKRFDSEEWKRMKELHALPDDWENMPYLSFLEERRKLMAAIIRRGFEALG